MLSALAACSSAQRADDGGQNDGGTRGLVSIDDPTQQHAQSTADAAASSDAGNAAAPSVDPADIPRWEAHIRSAPYRKLVIELDVTPGFEPENGVVQDVANTLGDVLDKPDGIEVMLDGTIAPAGASHAWTVKELGALADAELDLALPENVDRVHVMFVDGHDASDADGGVILGLAWDHLQIVMYKQSLKSQCDQLLATLSSGLCRAAEVAVLTHEMGHVIGLTDNGLQMVQDHLDRAHGHHDADMQSVMYWQYERDSLFDTLLGRLQSGKSPRLEFDAHSLDDIAAVRER